MSQNDEAPESLKKQDAQQSIQQAGIVSSAELLDGRRELLISHQGEVYRLRLTRQDKLILHK